MLRQKALVRFYLKISRFKEIPFFYFFAQHKKSYKIKSVFSNAQQPERLISQLKTMNIEEKARGAARVVVIRQPKGPDGTKGFAPRGNKEKSPVVVMDLMEQLTAQ